MNFMNIAKKRYSVRNFKEDKVTPDDLNTILEAGRVAPTGKNSQPQRLIVIQSPEGLEKVSKAARTYNAPLVVLVCTDTDEVWQRSYDSKKITDIDASIVTDHMMLQATELGLGSVWICWFEPDIIRREFDLPDHLEPVNILAIGYGEENTGLAASPDRHDKLRKPLEETVFFEHL